MTLTRDDHVIVVGGGLAGWRFCEFARRAGFEGRLSVVSDETHPPYDRPPLSKQVLTGKWPSDQTTLATADAHLAAHVELRLGQAATALDVATRTVSLADGTSLTGTHVVIATGVRARQLPFSAAGAIHSLRSRDDTERVLAAVERLTEGDLAVVIGGGFIGAEVATSLKTRGLRVVVLEAAERPLIGALGLTASAWLSELASGAGVELRNGETVHDVEMHEGRFVVRTGDGDLDAGIVVVGAGSAVNTEWLSGCGLRVDNGVVVDEHFQAAANIAAIGDVARFPFRHAGDEAVVRIEHWQVANDHASALADWWVSGVEPHAMVPYFWSDQYGKKIQMLGHPSPHDEIQMVQGSVEEGRWLALYSNAAGTVTGVLSLSQPRWLMVSKVLLDQVTTTEQALAQAPWSA